VVVWSTKKSGLTRGPRIADNSLCPVQRQPNIICLNSTIRSQNHTSEIHRLTPKQELRHLFCFQSLKASSFRLPIGFSLRPSARTQRKERTLDIYFHGPMEDADTAQLSGYDVARQLVLEELDLEMRLGQKLQQTVESRIAWATYLQSSLSAVSESQGTLFFRR
jgi:hypothetical protein